MLREERRDDLRNHQGKARRERKVAMKEEEKQRRREAWKIHQNREREEREVIAFLKASWEEIFPLSVEEKIKATEEPLTRQERVFVGVDNKTVEEEQEEDWETEASHSAFTWGSGWKEAKIHQNREREEREEIEWRKAQARQAKGRVQVRN